MTLTEKYRPQTLADIRGQDMITKSLEIYARNPSPKAFLLAGPSGCGKTSTAYALARAIGCDTAKGEFGGLYEIASGDCTAESVRGLFNTSLQYHTWTGSGWKVLIVNEADNMTDKAAFIWLDVLEKLPAKVVVVFTTNDASKFSSRFKSRCECYTFKAKARSDKAANLTAEIAAQKLVDDIWQAELGHNHAPRLAELDDWNDDGNVNFRAVVQALEPRIRLQREADQSQPARPPAPAPAPAGKLASVVHAGASEPAPVAPVTAGDFVVRIPSRA